MGGQDLTQEAFCRAYDRWGLVGGYDRPDQWVRHVAFNLATNRLRHLRVAVRHLARQREEHAEEPSPDRVALARALEKLPAKQRLAVVLHHFGELSTSEIAAQQGVAEGTVRSWLSRGRSALAELLIEAPVTFAPAPPISETFSKVRRRRAAKRATLAVILVILALVPIAIILRGKGSEPLPISPTTPPARPVSSCTAKVLPRIPNEPPPWLIGGDPSGRYLIGAVHRDTSRPVPVLWTDGVASTFVIPDGFLTGVAVNSHGVVAGSSGDDNKSSYKVWTYANGRLSILMETADVQRARTVMGINARGDILLSYDWTRPPAIRLAGSRPVVRELALPPGVDRVVATGLSEDGTVVGYTDDSTNALVWTPDQKVRRLPAPDTGWTTMATRVRGDWVLGVGEKSGSGSGSVDNYGPLMWNLRTGEIYKLGAPDAVVGVTSQGWVLRETPALKASIEMEGTSLPLPDLTDGPRINHLGVNFLSDDARVVGGNSRLESNGSDQPVSWTCS